MESPTTPDLTTASTGELLDELRRREGVVVNAYAGDGQMMPLYVLGPCLVVLVHGTVPETAKAEPNAQEVAA